MAVMMPRQSWTDERLDHFEKRVDERFDRIDERFDRVDAEFARVDKRFDKVEVDVRELRQTMNHGFFALVAIMITGFLSLAGLIVF